ncbi:hypothetical protein DRJ58_03635 [Candidatus Acetothermia bacterium]|nr:MAG: hypothetical protein DRJ58_03635 [Candidatus Acetothermia bacterium]
MHDEETGQQVQSGVQVPVVLEALKAEGKGGRSPSGPDLRVHPVALAKWKRRFLEHGAEVFGGKNGDALRVTRDGD